MRHCCVQLFTEEWSLEVYWVSADHAQGHRNAMLITKQSGCKGSPKFKCCHCPASALVQRWGDEIRNFWIGNLSMRARPSALLHRQTSVNCRTPRDHTHGVQNRIPCNSSAAFWACGAPRSASRGSGEAPHSTDVRTYRPVTVPLYFKSMKRFHHFHPSAVGCRCTAYVTVLDVLDVSYLSYHMLLSCLYMTHRHPWLCVKYGMAETWGPWSQSMTSLLVLQLVKAITTITILSCIQTSCVSLKATPFGRWCSLMTRISMGIPHHIH